MNILPHKSWHVRTKKNIERVRRDEEKAAEEEKEKQRRIALAEQEARTDLLRKRAKQRSRDEIEDSAEKVPRLSDAVESGPSSKAVDIYTTSGHMNFFKDIEAGEIKSGKNAEHEAEKKAEKEKWEKDIGLLTYLGQSAVETQEKKPWYLDSRKESEDIDQSIVKDKKLKDRIDPLGDMKSYLHKKKHKHKDKKKEKEHKQRDKEKEYKHKHKKKSKDKDYSEKHSSAKKTIEQLRAERLKREQEERQRTKLFLAGPKEKTSSEEAEVNERDRGYNSVFNPDFVRKPRHKRAYEDI